MLRLHLSRRALSSSLSVALCRVFCTSTPCQSDWMANNDILLNATAAMKRKRERSRNPNAVGKSHTHESTKYLNSNVSGKNHSKKPLKRTKNIVIRWTTGSDRAKEVANSVMSKIFHMNHEGSIKVVNPATNSMEQTNIRQFAKGINLDEIGLSIVDVDQIDEYTKVPLVKLVESRVAFKKYSDEMAKQKEKELLEMGVIKRPSKSSDADKSESSIKRLKISWQIKPDDLSKQKAHDMITQLKKGFRVYIYIDSKNNGNTRNWLDNFENIESQHLSDGKKLSKKELEQRSFVLERIIALLEEYSTQPVIDGTIEGKMLVKLAPKPSASDQKDKQNLREKRKRERQEKLQKRIEKKMRRGNG